MRSVKEAEQFSEDIPEVVVTMLCVHTHTDTKSNQNNNNKLPRRVQ